MRAGRIDVEFAAPPRCKGCDGACLWYRVADRQLVTFATPLDLGVGVTVTVTLPDRYLLLGALFVYGVPLLALLAGAVLGASVSDSDLGAAAGAALGLVAALGSAPVLRGGLERVTVREMVVQRAGS